jgi:glycerophosphoryl diester phosphodiesterase
MKTLNYNFWKWFGKSKVVNGKTPMKVYHGTNETFKSFKNEWIGHNTGNYGHYGYGHYFSDDIREAKGYGSKIIECYIKIENPFTGTDKEMLLLKRNGVEEIDDMVIQSIDYDSLYNEIKKIDSNAALLMDYVKQYGLEEAWDKFYEEKIKTKEYYNDLSNITVEYTTLNKNSRLEVPEFVFNELKEMGVKLSKLVYNQGFKYDQSLHWITKLGDLSKYVTEVIKKLGYDGVIYGSEYVVFYPNYIKSVDNDGSWDIDDEDIFS